MTDPMPAVTCPQCGGEHMPGHPGGLLYWRHEMTCPLLAKEDSRALADSTLAHARGWPFDRPVTDTERVLLSALGYELPDDAVTTVDYLTTAVRRRRWAVA